MTNTTDREELRKILSDHYYNDADPLQSILAWHEQKVAEEKSTLLLELRDDSSEDLNN